MVKKLWIIGCAQGLPTPYSMYSLPSQLSPLIALHSTAPPEKRPSNALGSRSMCCCAWTCPLAHPYQLARYFLEQWHYQTHVRCAGPLGTSPRSSFEMAVRLRNRNFRNGGFFWIRLPYLSQCHSQLRTHLPFGVWAFPRGCQSSTGSFGFTCRLHMQVEVVAAFPSSSIYR